VILARGCGHAGLYLQIVGRVLRPAPGKSAALLVDLAGSIHDHGHPLEDREYSLTGIAIKRAPGARSLWQCRECGLVLTAGPRDRCCPRCQTPLPPPKQQEIQANGRLIDVHWTCRECGHRRSAQPLSCPMCGAETPRARRVGAETDDERGRYLAQLEETARTRGYKPGWAAWKYKSKYGEWPRRVA
jgi:superfamily II DNA or RNA helicase